MDAPQDQELDEAASDEVWRYLLFAETNLLIAKSILADWVEGEEEAAFHLGRGWYGYASYLAAKANEPLPAAETFHETLPVERLPLSGVSPAEFRDQIRQFRSEWAAALDAYRRNEAWDDGILRSHIRILSGELDRLRRDDPALKSRYRHPRSLRAAKFIGGSVLVTAAALAIFSAATRNGAAPATNPEPVSESRPISAEAAPHTAPSEDPAAAATAPKGPWRVAFYANESLTATPRKISFYPAIDFQWGLRAAFEGFQTDHFSVRADTCLAVAERTTLPLELVADDGARVLLDATPVIDRWEARGFRERFDLEVPEGSHHLVIEYTQARGASGFSLMQKGDREYDLPLPQEMLSAPELLYYGSNPCSPAARPEADGEGAPEDVDAAK